MAFEIKRKAELTLVSVLAELIDPSGRQCLAPVRSHDSGLHKKVFGKLPLIFNRLAGSMIYPHLD
jgi:hypothetical protein